MEPEWDLPEDENLPTDWPSKGEISFDKLVFRYRENLDPVIKGEAECFVAYVYPPLFLFSPFAPRPSSLFPAYLCF